MTRRPLLIHCPLAEGGIAEHAHYQANALTKRGQEVVMLVGPRFLPDQANKTYKTLPWLLPLYARTRVRILKAAYFAFATVFNELILAFRILFWGHRRVLLAATSETLALLWAWPHVLLRAMGVRYAANIHDPQRKRLEGSALIHRWSIHAGFLPVSIGLVHEEFDRNQPDIPAHVECVRVPYGCFDAHITPGDGATLRAELIPEGESRTIFLGFGYIADRKNIDLSIRAVAEVPEAVLIVAGRQSSRHDKPASWYRDLAEQLGCADRVRIDDGFIPEAMIAEYFGAADVILLTYKAEFVSQSGVLMLASNWAKPVLASSGPGPLTTTVRQFDLGLTVPPDDLAGLRTAMAGLVRHGHSAKGWSSFRERASWDRNVEALIRAFDGSGEFDNAGRSDRRPDALSNARSSTGR